MDLFGVAPKNALMGRWPGGGGARDADLGGAMRETTMDARE